MSDAEDGMYVLSWREPGWAESDSLAWRARIFNSWDEPQSRYGAGDTREAAIADCHQRWDDDQDDHARSQASAQRYSLDDARAVSIGAARVS